MRNSTISFSNITQVFLCCFQGSSSPPTSFYSSASTVKEERRRSSFELAHIFPDPDYRRCASPRSSNTAMIRRPKFCPTLPTIYEESESDSDPQCGVTRTLRRQGDRSIASVKSSAEMLPMFASDSLDKLREFVSETTIRSYHTAPVKSTSETTIQSYHTAQTESVEKPCAEAAAVDQDDEVLKHMGDILLEELKVGNGKEKGRDDVWW